MSLAVEEHAPVAVIGLGNVLFGDDGFGPFVIELLRAGWDFPEGIALIDVGTPGLDLVTHLRGHEMVVLVDAVRATGRPGDLRLYRSEDLRNIPPKPRVSPHDPAVRETLCIAELAGCAPRQVLLVGMIPGSLRLGAGLSVAARRASWSAAAAVVRELTEAGLAPLARRQPRSPNAWWMRP